MMDGRNCSGRTISLLNSSDVTACYSAQIHPPLLTAHSRASSCASTPSLSPQTPQLLRSISSSSDSRGFQSPSPLTPSFGTFDQGAHAFAPKPQQQHYYIDNHAPGKMDEPRGSMYPPIPDATGAMQSAYPMPPQMSQAMAQQMPQPMPPQSMQQHYRSSNSPASEPSHVSTVSAASNNKAQPKKNQYPCPMAKQIGCTDFFTTSGHAARHAKKHTGKKDAFCPECNKAFTRKDNMEQHRRTHQNGRGGSRSGNEDSKVKKSTKQPSKKTSVKTEPQFEAAVEHQLAEQQQQQQAQAQAQAAHLQQVAQQPLIDQALMMPPTGPYYIGGGVDTGPVPSLPMVMPDLNGVRPPLHRSNFTNSLEYIPPAPSMIADPDGLHYSYPSPGLSNGLNSLALAASEHQRRQSDKSQSRSPSESSSQETP